MFGRSLLAALFGIPLLATGSGSAFAADDASVRAGIEPIIAEFAKDYNSKNIAALSDLYSEDAMLLPPDQAPADGRGEIRKRWQAAADAGVTGLTLQTVDVQGSGDYAYEVGKFTLKAPGKDGKLGDAAGKYVVVWKKAADGRWRLHRDIWNSDPPAKRQ